jgi:RNA polymerase sigma factor (sigma-70 family)
VQIVPGLRSAVRPGEFSESAQQRLLRQLRGLGRHAETILVDTGSGAHEVARRFWAAADAEPAGRGIPAAGQVQRRTHLGNGLPEGVELDDLISAGVFGLMDAIDAFDLSRGVKFETYCVPRIRGAMLDELRTMDWVPRLVRSKASKLQKPPRPWKPDSAASHRTGTGRAHGA